MYGPVIENWSKDRNKSKLPVYGDSRPSKDAYYMNIAKAVSMRSTCLVRQYGCVIVNNDEIVATGYNGNPRGIPNCVDIGFCSKECKDHNSSIDSYNTCRSVHAEMNALLSASRNELNGATLYLYGWDSETGEIDNPQPCPICTRLIQNTGITKMVYNSASASWK